MPAGVHVVTVGGVDVSCLVDEVSISHGRDDPGSQPDASSCTVNFTSTPADPLPVEVDVGAAVVVTTTTAGGSSTRFVGRVTDLSLGWDDAGENTPDAGVGQLVAVGPLADLGRRVVGDEPWPVELDGARVARVMVAAGRPLDPLYSDPGTVSVVARDVDAQAALELARVAAVDAAGVLWETRAGEVRYADADHRRRAAVALTLDSCDLLVTPSWRRNIEGLINEVSIGYGVAPEGGEQPVYAATSPTSVTRWGRFGYSSTTTLAALADAEAMGQLLLVRNGEPVWVMAALPVDVEGLDATRYSALLGLDVHALVMLTGLPSLGHAPTVAQLWVEGWHEVLTYGGHEVELVVSGYCRTSPPPTWDDVDPGWTWGDYALTETRRNLVLNPSVEVDTAGWAASGAGTTVARVTSSPDVGAAALAFTTGTGTTSGASVSVPGLTAGKTYGARLRARPGVVSDLRITIQWQDAGGAANGSVSATVPACPANTYATLTTSGVAPAGTAQARVYCQRVADSTAGLVVNVDAVLVAEAVGGTFDPTYFDGDTLDTAETEYAWTGTPHASSSTQSLVTPGGGTGLPPGLTWDSATCLGPPFTDFGRWADQPATLRWDQVAPAQTWDTYQTPIGT